MRKGLDTKKIIQIAIEMIEQEGLAGFSLHKLAEHLEIKTASLYNHFSNYDDLMTQISVEVIHLLIQNLQAAIQNQTGDQSIYALSQAYYQFGMSHHELYQIFMQSRGHNQTLEKDPFLEA